MRTTRRVFAMLLCIIMCMSLVPPGAFAETDFGDSTEEAEPAENTAEPATDTTEPAEEPVTEPAQETPEVITAISEETVTNEASLTETVSEGTFGTDLFWTLDDEGTLTISGTGAMPDWSNSTYAPWYSSSSSVTAVVIESGVTSISNYAFSNYKNLTSVSIAGSVKEIGSYAFYLCTALTDVTVPAGTETVGKYAFAKCSALGSITLNNAVIGEYMFYDCDGLTGITVPANVTDVGTYAFAECGALSQLSLKNSKISKNMFYNCDGLTAVTIPADITEIGADAFNNCSALTSAVLNNDVIGESMFKSCTKLANVTIGQGVKSIGSYAFYCCSALEAVRIPDGVESIGVQAFYACDGLTSITIPASVTEIGTGAFKSCSGITSITLKNNIIGASMFYDCDGLTSVTIPSGIESIGSQAFAGCGKLTNITINNSLIGVSMFSDCSALAAVTIPAGVTEIGEKAFYNCDALLSVTMNNTFIGAYMFYDCDKLAGVSIPDQVESIGEFAFSRCDGLKAVAIGSGVKSIGNSAFSSCTALESVYIPSNVESIGSSAFSSCSVLADVVIQNGVKSIGAGAFQSCSALTGITIPDSVTFLGGSAFSTCKALISAKIGAGVADIGSQTFEYCSKLQEIVIPDSVQSIGDYAFNYCSALSYAEIGQNVKSIGKYAFQNCTALTGIIIPDSVQSLGLQAFYNCSALTTALIGDGVTDIGSNAFAGCSALEGLTIGSSVQSIGSSAFKNCTALAVVTLPFTVTVINASAFYNCTALKKVTFQGNAPTIGSSVFYGATLTAFYPSNSSTWTDSVKQNYGGTVTWTGYTDESAIAFGTCGDNVYFRLDVNGTLTINGTGPMTDWLNPDNVIWKEYRTAVKLVIISGSVTSIGDYVFYGFTGLRSVSICKSVTSIGKYSFALCSELAEVEIPTGVTSIGEQAFSGCNSLTEIEIPAGVTSIGDDAFFDCSQLESITVAEDNTKYSSEDGVLFNYAKTTLIVYPAGKTNKTDVVETDAYYCFPNSVTKIEQHAFYGNSHLQSLAIPASVTSIGGEAFSHCSSLTDVWFKCDNDRGSTYSAPSIGDNAFYGDTLTAHFPIYNSAWAVENNATQPDYGGKEITWSSYAVFQLDRDNNNYTNSDETEADGFYGFKGRLVDDGFLNQLRSPVDKAMLKKYMQNSWNGACYGISASMGFLLKGYIGISDLTDNSASDYWSLPELPWKDSKLRNTIHFYDLTKYLFGAGSPYNSMLCQTDTEDSSTDTLPVFLEKLVKLASEDAVYFFAFNYRYGESSTSGHMVMITGCSYDPVAQQYLVQIYDEDIIQAGGRGDFKIMTVEKDFSAFTYETCSGRAFNETTYISMSIQDFGKMYESITGTELVSDHTHLRFLKGTGMTITNAEGQTLVYDGTNFSGDMPYYSIYTPYDDETDKKLEKYVTVETASSDYFTFDTEGTFDFEVADADSYEGVSGSGVCSITVNLTEDTIVIRGTEYTLRVYMQTDNISADEPGLIFVSANATSDVTISRQGTSVTVTSDKPLTNLVTTDYIGVEAIETQHDSTTGLTVTAGTSSGSTEPARVWTLKDLLILKSALANDDAASLASLDEDVNSDGAVNLLDLLALRQKLADA